MCIQKWHGEEGSTSLKVGVFLQQTYGKLWEKHHSSLLFAGGKCHDNETCQDHRENTAELGEKQLTSCSFFTMSLGGYFCNAKSIYKSVWDGMTEQQLISDRFKHSDLCVQSQSHLQQEILSQSQLLAHLLLDGPMVLAWQRRKPGVTKPFHPQLLT